MDTGEGKTEIMADISEESKMREKYPKAGGVFTVGEELEIKGSRFRVKRINPFGILLKVLPKK
jgi:uncharacterized Zn finger protein